MPKGAKGASGATRDIGRTVDPVVVVDLQVRGAIIIAVGHHFAKDTCIAGSWRRVEPQEQRRQRRRPVVRVLPAERRRGRAEP